LQKLTPKQKRFVDEYLVDLNAKKAAIRAGYSEKTAKAIGFENLTKPSVQKYLSERQKARSSRTEITQDRVLEEYAKLAYVQPKDFYGEDGDVLPIHQMPDDVAACITGIDVSNRKIGEDDYETIKKIRFADKKGALDSLAKHLGMFSEDSRKSDTPTTINITLSDA